MRGPVALRENIESNEKQVIMINNSFGIAHKLLEY